MMVEQEDLFSIRQLEIPGGDDFPTLERIADRPDLLAEIFKPRRAAAGVERREMPVPSSVINGF